MPGPTVYLDKFLNFFQTFPSIKVGQRPFQMTMVKLNQIPCVCVCAFSRFNHVQLFVTLTTCHALLQGILLTQGSNSYLLHLLHWRQILYHWASREAIDSHVSITNYGLSHNDLLTNLSASLCPFPCLDPFIPKYQFPRAGTVSQGKVLRSRSSAPHLNAVETRKLHTQKTTSTLIPLFPCNGFCKISWKKQMANCFLMVSPHPRLKVQVIWAWDCGEEQRMNLEKMYYLVILSLTWFDAGIMIVIFQKWIFPPRRLWIPMTVESQWDPFQQQQQQQKIKILRRNDSIEFCSEKFSVKRDAVCHFIPKGFIPLLSKIDKVRRSIKEEHCCFYFYMISTQFIIWWCYLSKASTSDLRNTVYVSEVQKKDILPIISFSRRNNKLFWQQRSKIRTLVKQFHKMIHQSHWNHRL